MTDRMLETLANESAAQSSYERGYAAPNPPQRRTGPVAIDTPRLADGRYTRPGNIACVVPVLLPNGLIGWQVGPRGRIYDRREHAMAYAKRRQAYYGS